MSKALMNKYITKYDAIQAMKSGRTREESEWAIKSIKAVKLKRSKKVTPTFFKGESERCPHCGRKLEIYDLTYDMPKYVYCFWCGGAVKRAKGKKNPEFDYSMIEGEDEA